MKKVSRHRQRWKFRAGGDANDDGSKMKCLPAYRLSTALRSDLATHDNYTISLKEPGCSEHESAFL
jgi:hypothetical protein